MEWSQSGWYALIALCCIALGYSVGMRRARRVRRRVVQQMNTQSLELLDAKASVNQLQDYADRQQRKDNLLKLTLTRLQSANRQIYTQQQLLESHQKKHFIELSRMRMHAIKARETAHKAAGIARKAMLHLHRLEKASPLTQTIAPPEPKSYGNSDPVTVSVMDQCSLNGSGNAIAQVSNRDPARLSKLRSSKVATAN